MRELLFTKRILILSAILSSTVFALPTGVTMKPFYDFDKASFVEAKVKTIWMEEVPGLPQHFYVLGQLGYIHTLYPNGYDPKSLKPNTSLDYTRTQIADFHTEVHPNIRAEYGAWCMTFHNNFQENGKFYIIYLGLYPGQTNFKGRSGGIVKLDEWQASGEKFTEVKKLRTLLTYNHKTSWGSSCMTMGPDSFIYAAICDYRTDSYDLTHFGRKILRIDPDNKDPGFEYSIPKDNPFYNDPDPKVKKEIWAYGIRNVWGIHFDPITGDLFSGEIGQSMWEELNIIKKGTNGGWADKADGESPKYGYGFSGPCHSGPLASSRSKERECNKFEDPFWAFPRKGHLVTGKINEESNYIPMASVLGGQSFMGAKDSPFYGYHIFGDTEDGQLYATKAHQRATYNWNTSSSPAKAEIEGTAPQLIGQSPKAISRNNDGHDGIAYIGRDTFGFLYAVYVSWNPGKDWHEIYRIDHPDMKPAIAGCTDSIYTGYNAKAEIHDATQCGPVAVDKIPLLKRQAGRPVITNISGVGSVSVPQGVSGFSLYAIDGKLAWQYKRKNINNRESVAVPNRIAKGVYRVHYLWQ